MAPAGKADKRNARRRSCSLRRGHFAQANAASGMPARAAAGVYARQAPWANTAFLLLLSSPLLVLALACASPAPVVQGPVVSVDRAARTIAVQDESHPTEPPLTFDISKAEIGGEPKEGDIVRLAYRPTTAGNVALRVMNLTQQKARREKGS